MDHELPRAARFWSVLYAIDQDWAETTRKKNLRPAGACTRPTTYESHAAPLSSFPSKSAREAINAQPLEKVKLG
jgi:hypothetical protein